MAKQIPTAEARLSCLCGAVAIPGTYLESSTFPVRTITCHCNPCRHVTGSLLPVFAWLNATPPTSVLSRVTAYHFTDRCTRYFCSTCGCVCLVELPRVAKWACAAGIITPPPGVKDVVHLSSHGYVSDTLDGGLVPLLLAPGDEPLSIFGVGHSKDSISVESVLRLAESSLGRHITDSNAMLRASCHCGGVSFLISSSHQKRSAVTSPDRHPAHFCACKSCRLSTGTSLQGWAQVPVGAIRSTANGCPIVLGYRNEAAVSGDWSKLRYFWNSETSQHSFCGDCGATIFLYRMQPDAHAVVAVSVGILRAESGSMSREWLEWADGKIDSKEEMVDRSIMHCVEKGWKQLVLQQIKD